VQLGLVRQGGLLISLKGVRMPRELINISVLLDQCLGFSIKDLNLKDPKDKKEFGRRLDEAYERAKAEEAAAEEAKLKE
jgi:hypothetical protein